MRRRRAGRYVDLSVQCKSFRVQCGGFVSMCGCFHDSVWRLHSKFLWERGDTLTRQHIHPTVVWDPVYNDSVLVCGV